MVLSKRRLLTPSPSRRDPLGRLLAQMPLHTLDDTGILITAELPSGALAGVALARTLQLQKSLVGVEAAVKARAAYHAYRLYRDCARACAMY
jgi:hypothetical protein